MNSATIERLESSFALIAPQGEKLVDQFYSRLFAENPSLRSMFPADITEQKRKLLASIVLVRENIRRTENLAEPLTKLGERHLEFGAEAEHYPIVRDTLIATMKELAGDQWNEQLTEDWAGALDFISSIMITGADNVHSRRKAA